MNESNSFRPGSTWEFRGMPSVHLLGKTKIIVEEREAERVCRKRCTSRHRHEERMHSISKKGKGHLKHLENRRNNVSVAFKERAGDLATNEIAFRPINLIYASVYRDALPGFDFRNTGTISLSPISEAKNTRKWLFFFQTPRFFIRPRISPLSDAFGICNKYQLGKIVSALISASFVRN